MKKITLLAFVALQGLSALGFGSMGNTSAGLGDSGVALRKSAWGVYYNPALLAADNRGKFGYSFGATVEERGIDTMALSLLGGGEMDINSIWNAYQSSPNHTLSVISQNGLVIQITGGVHEAPKLDAEGNPTEEMIEKRNPYGAFTMAVFASGVVYGKVDALKSADTITITDKTRLDGIALIEAPIGWGWKFETGFGDFSIGAAVKYMGALGASASVTGSLSEMDGPQIEYVYHLPQSPALSHNFGIDLGFLYSIYGVNVGLVAKNINVPSFDIGGHRFKVMPQFRAGISYEFAEYFALTFDTDLAPNYILDEHSPKTQMIGGGLLMDFKYIDLRFGVMGDMANKFEQSAILTGGINLLGFLDVAVQASMKMFEVNTYKVPNLVTLKVGGSFTF